MLLPQDLPDQFLLKYVELAAVKSQDRAPFSFGITSVDADRALEHLATRSKSVRGQEVVALGLLPNSAHGLLAKDAGVRVCLR